MTNISPVQILLVEDSPDDIYLTEMAFKRFKIRNDLHIAKDGVEAMEFLRHKGAFSDAPRPDMVLLDLNMPRMDGREVLREIKSDAELRRIPVVIMTTSGHEEDVAHAYDLHANCYVTKPLGFEEFQKVVASLEGFWFSIVRLPPA